MTEMDKTKIAAQGTSCTTCFHTAEYKKRTANRYWWWRIDNTTYDPLLYFLLSEEEKKILDAWYDETDTLGYTGECSVPLASFLIGFIMGNAVRRIVQLGHFAGFSSLCLGFALKKMRTGKCVSIDYNEKISKYANSWIVRAGLQEQVTILVGDSAAPDIVESGIAELKGAPDMVFIDSAHTYDHTIKELDIWMPRVRQNGFVFLHDASSKAKKYDKSGRGVADGIHDWCQRNNYKYFVFNDGNCTVQPGLTHADLVYRDGCGLGIIQKIIH